MAEQRDRRPELMKKAEAMTSGHPPEDREALLIKNWMSHDARWFVAVAEAFGLEAANRLNKTAAHEIGKVEVKRIARALGQAPIVELDDYLVLQEVLISFLGPDLIDYAIVQTGDNEYQLQVQRCFAHENVTRAGVAETYECGILARVTGWMEALGLKYEMTPPLGKCMKAAGRECVYNFRFKGGPSGTSAAT